MVVEQIIRPTGLVDPEVEIRPVAGQIDDLLHEIRDRAQKGERVLVTTLTKRMAEDLAGYYSEVGVRCRYMHSEIETLERVSCCAICARASTTYWSASTCCARAWICPKFRWSRSSTPTRKASCARPVR